jgi:hypothetical protein
MIDWTTVLALFSAIIGLASAIASAYSARASREAARVAKAALAAAREEAHVRADLTRMVARSYLVEFETHLGAHGPLSPLGAAAAPWLDELKVLRSDWAHLEPHERILLLAAVRAVEATQQECPPEVQRERGDAAKVAVTAALRALARERGAA